MGSYYLCILFQLSMNLPEESRDPFKNQLDKFNQQSIFMIQDILFLTSTVFGGSLIYFNWSMNKSILWIRNFDIYLTNILNFIKFYFMDKDNKKGAPLFSRISSHPTFKVDLRQEDKVIRRSWSINKVPYLMKSTFINKDALKFKFSTINRAKVEDMKLKGFISNRDWDLSVLNRKDIYQNNDPFKSLPELPTRSFNLNPLVKVKTLKEFLKCESHWINHPKDI